MFTTLAVLLLCSGPAAAAGDQSTDPTFVFVGTVVEAESSTLAQLAASSETYAVQVDEVLLQMGTFGDQGGRRVTVVVAGDRLEAGGRYLFHTQPFMFGDSVAVRALEVESAARQDAKVAEEMFSSFELEAVRRRVEQAGTVVSGMVTSVREVEQPPMESEHLPDLRQAVVRIESVLKGAVAGEEISFVFAASRDVQYIDAPKFEEGDTGIFMLNAGTQRAATMRLAIEQFTLFDAQDFQPAEMLEAIRGMAQ
jgi:hypothetical protein